MSPSLSYTLRFPAPQTHYVDVEARLRCPDPSPELFLAVWTPGSYLVREYSRHIEAVRARSEAGAPLAVAKTRKNRWRVEADAGERIVVEYSVYCRDMSVRGNWVEQDFALLNGAPTFLSLPTALDAPHEIRVHLAPDWSDVVCALDPEKRDSGAAFLAPNYETLVDSPLICGRPAIHEFEASGTKHFLINVEETEAWDGPRSANDVRKIVETQHSFWGEVPYEHYAFFNLLTEASGGLEHANSTVLMTSRWKTEEREPYLDWLGLVSHEFFHTWNVKRLRPIELGPFDFESEVYTRGLWVAEGITNYYTDLLVHRAGLSTESEYLRELSRFFERLLSAPGRGIQSLEESSFDAWIKLYRPDENSQNTSISYYVKGAVVAFLLDQKIRDATDDARSLDDVLRRAYRAFSGERGFTVEDFSRLAEEVAETRLGEWFDHALRSTRELDHESALGRVGLRLAEGRDAKRESNDSGDEASSPGSPCGARAWVGVGTKNEQGRLLITRVVRDSPAFEAGINVDDEILAIDDYRATPDRWVARIERRAPGETVKVLVARRERLRTLDVVLAPKPPEDRRLVVKSDATPEETRRREVWLRGGMIPLDSRPERQTEDGLARPALQRDERR